MQHRRQLRLIEKRSNGGAMEKVGWVATGLVALGLLAMAAMLANSLPELHRSLKMETM